MTVIDPLEARHTDRWLELKTMSVIHLTIIAAHVKLPVGCFKRMHDEISIVRAVNILIIRVN